MKKMSFFAAMLALILVATSAFKSAHKSLDPVYGLVSDDGNGSFVLIDLTNLSEGPEGDYECLDNGICKVIVTSGTPTAIAGTDDPNDYELVNGTIEPVPEDDGDFFYHPQGN